LRSDPSLAPKVARVDIVVAKTLGASTKDKDALRKPNATTTKTTKTTTYAITIDARRAFPTTARRRRRVRMMSQVARVDG
jgi:hypothetical protein